MNICNIHEHCACAFSSGLKHGQGRTYITHNILFLPFRSIFHHRQSHIPHFVATPRRRFSPPQLLTRTAPGIDLEVAWATILGTVGGQCVSLYVFARLLVFSMPRIRLSRRIYNGHFTYFIFFPPFGAGSGVVREREQPSHHVIFLLPSYHLESTHCSDPLRLT
ncbi:hypothetical protein C8R47DRAFT_590685 [Mycena vitilis]|nr:hypothetical protein C8R47DRAFT_590677 [Mycena vitilis]KAJ6481534.1 hypothetical protein C8R47DRAFT_590685 [Mycena vitilis]